MARSDKRLELRPVDDTVETQSPVIRLESKETLERGKQAQFNEVLEKLKVSQRLHLPPQSDVELRTHQPGIDALIESPAGDPDALEKDWGKQAVSHRSIPWGWFILLGIMLVGSAIWSLNQVKEADAQADHILASTLNVLENDAYEDIEAAKLVDRIESVTQDFFNATSVEDLARQCRHPERVMPLMERYYGGTKIPHNPLLHSNFLQPITLDKHANFWMQSVELRSHESRNLILEILDSGEPKVDWETLVCYQPMDWNEFARARPTGVSLDFRVYLEPDNFFSHEFANSKQWHSFRLTALGGDETLFGYARIDTAVSDELVSLLNENGGRRISAIIRVNIPEGIQSHRGVVIEKLLSPRWIYLDPPDA